MLVATCIGCLWAAFIVYLCDPGSSLFSWHPACMTVAYSVLMWVGALLPRASPAGRSGWWGRHHRQPLLSYRQRLVLHWLLTAGGVALALAGFVAIFANKQRRGGDVVHFSSPHGRYGLAVVGWTLAQAAVGVILLYRWPAPSAPPAGGVRGVAVRVLRALTLNKHTVRAAHALSGSLLLCCAFYNSWLGVRSAWMVAVLQSLPVTYVAVCVASSCVLTTQAYHVVRALFKF